MSQAIKAVRGMNDILPPETTIWQEAERALSKIFQSYGYQEIRFPILEKTELFKRSIGEVTDIVEKEMYTFLDRNQESLTLRPEETAGCVRAVLENGMIHNQTQRLWYKGPCFRYEKPQKGRYRQFHQYGAEVFGLAGPDIDAELISMAAAIFEKLGIQSKCILQINTLGTQDVRKNYRQQLVKYFGKHHSALDEDSIKRLDKNPLRILDSKNPHMKPLITNAPKLIDFLDADSRIHFETLQNYLTHLNIPYEINPNLVRGLDYYTKTVFEWVTEELGAQGSVCAGGRYDRLVEQMGGKSTPALGFALGMERIVLLLKQRIPLYQPETRLHAYLIYDNDASFKYGLKLADFLRKKVPGLRLALHCGGGSLKNQIKKADKSDALYAIILGEREIQTRSVSFKHLREDVPQQTLTQDEFVDYLKLKIFKK